MRIGTRKKKNEKARDEWGEMVLKLPFLLAPTPHHLPPLGRAGLQSHWPGTTPLVFIPSASSSSAFPHGIQLPPALPLLPPFLIISMGGCWPIASESPTSLHPSSDFSDSSSSGLPIWLTYCTATLPISTCHL